MKNTKYVYFLTLVATLGGLLFGYDTAVISGTIESLRLFFIEPKRLTPELANSLEGFLISSALIGCIIGASIAGWISQRFGRKPTLQVAAILFLLSAVGSAFPELFICKIGAGNHSLMPLFIFYRIIGGVGVGLASMLSPMYIAEIAPAHLRGKLVSWNQFVLIFGMLIAYFANYIIARQGDSSWLHAFGWRWMFASEMIPASLFFIFLFFIPESPRFLVMNNKSQKALSILCRLSNKQTAENELNNIKNSFQQKSPSLRPYYLFIISWLLLFIVLTLLFKWIGFISYFQIALIVSFFLSLIIPVHSYGLRLIFIGVMIASFQQFIGINVVLYYAPEIFKTMGAETDTALLQQVIVGAVNLSFTVLAIFTVDKLGRRPLMIIGALIMAFAMITLGFTFFTHSVGFGSLFCMLLYTAGFAMSWGPICWVLLAEIFPNALRSVVMSIAVAAQWVSNFLISWTFPMLDKSNSLTMIFNHGFSYWIYGIMGLLAAFLIWKFVPETKGKNLEDMEKLYQKR